MPPNDQALLVAAIETCLSKALAPVVGRVQAVETAFADVGPLSARIAAVAAVVGRVQALERERLQVAGDIAVAQLHARLHAGADSGQRKHVRRPLAVTSPG